MRKNIRGELTEPRLKQKYSLQNNQMVMAIANSLKADDFADIKEIHSTITPVLVNSAVQAVSTLELIQQRNIELLRKLQKEGADFNSVDYLGRAALHVICNDKNNLEIAKFIVNEGSVNLDLLDSKQRSPLYIAIESDNWEVAELLCNEGATVIANQERLAKMLCQAGFDNDVAKIRLLHKCDINLEISDYDKRSVGHLAAAEGHFELLEFLAKNTMFNFEIEDRWHNKVLDECKQPEIKTKIE